MAIEDNVFFTTIAPIVGGILGITMFMSPTKAVLDVRRNQFLGALNPLPMAVTVVNCLGWVLYSTHQRDVYLFWPNALGLYVGIWMTLSLYPYASQKTRDLMNAAVVGGVGIFSLEVFALCLAHTDTDRVQLVLGITCNAVLVLFYASPLSEMARVIRERNSAYLYWPLSILVCINGVLWFCYGMAIQDWIVYAINGTGAVLSGIQLVLICIFPRKTEMPAVLSEDSPRSLKAATKTQVEMMLNGATSCTINTDAREAGSHSAAENIV